MGVSWFDNDKDFSSVYEKYVDIVYRISFMLLKNDSETEDVVQNVFIKLINCNKDFESEEHIKAWLIVCAKNECKNILKHWWRTKKVSIESIGEIATEDKLSYDETLKKVLSLPDKLKLPIYLYYYEGYSTEEISKILKVNHSTLRGQLKTAREKLKIMLKGGDNLE